MTREDETLDKEFDHECRFSRDEREWLHTANKYIDSRHLPMMGSILKALDDTAYFIGKAVLTALITIACGSLIWWIIMKVK